LICHAGKRQPSPRRRRRTIRRRIAIRVSDAAIVADLAATRPIDIAFIDGIETMSGGEGPWVGGI